MDHSLTEYGSASSRNRSKSHRDDVASREWREFMKEFCNLRRGWAEDSALLSSPARRFVENHNNRLDKCTFWAHFFRIPPSAVSGSPAPCGRSGRPSPSWSPLLGGRQTAADAGLDFLFEAVRLGKTATLVPSRWSFARRHMLDTLADWWGLQRHCGSIGGRGLFAPQLTCPRSSREQGSHLPYTPTGLLR